MLRPCLQPSADRNPWPGREYYGSIASVDKTVLWLGLFFFFFFFFFLSFRSSYLGLPIDRAFALLLTHHRSTID